MRTHPKAQAFLRSTATVALATLTALATAPIASAQAAAKPSAVTRDTPRPELALQYNFLRSNSPQGACGCLHLNGGSATFALPDPDGHLSVVADVTVTHAGSILGSTQDLLLTAVTAGVRYRPAFTYRHLQPYGQALIGLAHAGGSISQANPTSAGTVFAANLGGGADLALTRRFALRLIEADYLVTTFHNGGSNHQNNLRLTAGLVLRW